MNIVLEKVCCLCQKNRLAKCFYKNYLFIRVSSNVISNVVFYHVLRQVNEHRNLGFSYIIQRECKLYCKNILCASSNKATA